jgi:hypothetical protein
VSNSSGKPARILPIRACLDMQPLPTTDASCSSVGRGVAATSSQAPTTTRPPQNATHRDGSPTPTSLLARSPSPRLSAFLFQSPRARSPPRVGPRSRWPRAAAPCSRSSSSAIVGARFRSPPLAPLPLPPCVRFAFLSLADLCFL